MERFIFSVAALMLVQFLGNSAGFHVFRATMGAGGWRWLFYEPDCSDGLSRIEYLMATITDESILFRRMEHSFRRIFKQARVKSSPHFLSQALNTIADLILVRQRMAARAMERLTETLRHVLMNYCRHRVHHRVSGAEELGGIRWYPAIEKTRLEGRPRLRFEAGPVIGLPGIRTLIRMPFVESAIQQSVAPKAGPGLLKIAVRDAHGRLCRLVEGKGDGPHG